MKVVFKWAIVFFITTMLWMLFEKWMGWHDVRIAAHATYSLIYDLLFFAVYLFALLDFRKSLTQAYTWKKGIYYGILLTVVVTGLSPLVQTIMHTMISPDFFGNVITLAVENNLLSPDAARAKFNLTNYILENVFGTFLLGTFCTLLLASLLVMFNRPQVSSH